MNSRDLYSAIGKIDDDILEQSETVKKKKSRLKWGAAAACLCLMVGGGIFMKSQLQADPDDLPMLYIQDSAPGGMGFEGIWLYDIDEIENGNPWREDMTFSTLPVFENRAYHPVGEPRGLDEDAILERLETACAALGLENPELEYERIDQTVLSVSGKVEGITVTAEANSMIEVFFEDGLILPEHLSFTDYDTDYQEAVEAIDYLLQRFADLIDFKEPVPVSDGYYIMRNVYDQEGNSLREAQFYRTYMLYEGAGDETDRLLNYQMRYARFYPDAEGRLWIIRIYDALSCAEKLGDYPIITPAEARKSLLKGNYITSVPYEIKDKTLIRKEELVYRSSATDKTLMPYYRFQVELPEEEHENGLKTFGAYYVPAVSPKYISDTPLWDGSFN